MSLVCLSLRRLILFCFYFILQAPKLSYEELTEDYPRYPDVYDLDSEVQHDALVVRYQCVVRCDTGFCAVNHPSTFSQSEPHN